MSSESFNYTQSYGNYGSDGLYIDIAVLVHFDDTVVAHSIGVEPRIVIDGFAEKWQNGRAISTAIKITGPINGMARRRSAENENENETEAGAGGGGLIVKVSENKSRTQTKR